MARYRYKRPDIQFQQQFHLELIDKVFAKFLELFEVHIPIV